MSQSIVDQAVERVLPQIIDDDYRGTLKSQAIAKVWGRGVMAFEYELPVDKLQLTLLDFKQQLVDELHEYSRNHHFDASTTPEIQSVFRVTDIWEFEGKIHFDIAFLINQTTIEYVEDLNRLN
ncbi:hypothetical protein [Lentilactobacillus kosonis]|uniref:Uncharacterized protein n=1 Tax=Lentilactobacillus kosonis TaxID=2810561 RepID=A0A401FPF5_9LACO|nr:hypothetical protein [Lentilactobacillus kosonis]GAY74101.1 hypothetical protein NBRC111893_2247 [Lentilactobacillus kosonis]